MQERDQEHEEHATKTKNILRMQKHAYLYEKQIHASAKIFNMELKWQAVFQRTELKFVNACNTEMFFSSKAKSHLRDAPSIDPPHDDSGKSMFYTGLNVFLFPCLYCIYLEVAFLL